MKATYLYFEFWLRFCAIHSSKTLNGSISRGIYDLPPFRYPLACMRKVTFPRAVIPKTFLLNSLFSCDVTAAMLVYRTIAKKGFWDFDSIIMQKFRDILPLFCTPIWPSHHVSENQEYRHTFIRYMYHVDNQSALFLIFNHLWFIEFVFLNSH